MLRVPGSTWIETARNSFTSQVLKADVLQNGDRVFLLSDGWRWKPGVRTISCVAKMDGDDAGNVLQLRTRDPHGKGQREGTQASKCLFAAPDADGTDPARCAPKAPVSRRENREHPLFPNAPELDPTAQVSLLRLGLTPVP